MRPTMRDPELETALDRDGFVPIPGGARAVLDRIRAVYATAPTGEAVRAPSRISTNGSSGDDTWQSRMAPGTEWRISTDACSPAERADIREAMKALWAEVIDPILVDHHVVLSTFLTKFPGPESFLPLHQDPSVVDEREHRSVTVWIALDDIDDRHDNGRLHILLGSHRVGHEWRGTRTEPSYLDGLESLWSKAVPIDTAAGDVLLMDSRVLHGSPPNHDREPRAAVAGVTVPRTAPLLHAVGIDGDRVEILRVDEQFFIDHSPGSLRKHLPSGYEVVATLPRADPPMSVDALLAQQRAENKRRRRFRARFTRAKPRSIGR